LRTRNALLWLGRAVDVLICASLAWLALLSRELDAGNPELAHIVGRAPFLISLACQYSLLFGLPLLTLHALRLWLLRRGLAADRWLLLPLAAGLAGPAYRQAELLTSGGLLFESKYAALIRVAILATLLAANWSLWHVHLLLVAAPGYTAWRGVDRIRRATDRTRGRARSWLGKLTTLLWLVPAVLLLDAFARAIDERLRAYMFLCRFLLPSAWLFATTLLWALLVRLRWPRGWLRAIGGGLLVAGLCAGQLATRELRRAKAEYERRGGAVALTDLAVSIQRGAPYANLDISQPARFRCLPPTAASLPAPPPLPTPIAQRHNVILISIDTLRKDALSMQLDGKPAAPALQALAAKSLSFERAVTTYPATLFALGSALTGQSPSEVLFAPKPPDNLFTQTKHKFDEQLIALPRIGWFQRHPVPELLTQNVAAVYWPDAETSTTWMINRLRMARAFGHRTLAWIHYFEPHTSEVSGRGKAAETGAKHSYARLVHQVDQQVGRLVKALETLGYLQDSLLIVFSDHGEALGEFDYYGHHVYLNQFATDVPLLVHAPALTPQRSEQLVLLSDITPTVLAWLNMPVGMSDARSLFSTDATQRYGLSEAFPIRGRALYEMARAPITDATLLHERMQLIRTAAFDYQPKVSLVSARYRLIVNRETGSEEFYDRVRDPNEEHELSQDGLAVQQQMRQALGKLQRELSERIYCKVIGQPAR
jgi:choline-sulfatase